MNCNRFTSSRAGMPGMLACLAALAAPSEAQIKVLVYRGFFGYQHSALLTATATIRTTMPTLLAGEPAFSADEAADPTALTAANLANYQVLFLNNNTGIGGLTTVQRAAVMGFAQTKGVVAIHSTADFKGGGSWPEMVTMIGGSLDGHTAAMGKLRREAAQVNHPINAGLAAEAWMNDEWYGYATNPRNAAGTVVLTNIDESTMSWTGGGSMGDHPISWCKELQGGGRLFYTAMGHRDSIMQKNAFARRQVYNAILWAGKASPPTVVPASSPGESAIRTASGRGSLRVSFPEEGGHAFTVATLDGRRLESRAGQGIREYTVTGLRPGAVYAVSGHSRAGRFSRRVSIP